MEGVRTTIPRLRNIWPRRYHETMSRCCVARPCRGNQSPRTPKIRKNTSSASKMFANSFVRHLAKTMSTQTVLCTSTPHVQVLCGWAEKMRNGPVFEITKDMPVIDNCKAFVGRPWFWDPERKQWVGVAHWPLFVSVGNCRKRSSKSLSSTFQFTAAERAKAK